MKKSNGKGLSRNINKEDFSEYCSVSGNIVTFPIIKEMTYSYGRQECNLELLQNDKPIYSCSFYLRVNKAPVQQSDVFDSDDYKTVHDEFLKLESEVDSMSNEVYSTTATPPEGQKDGDYWTRLL